MTDRPIIFSGPMVRALLHGRKTQTRRVLNIHPDREPPYVAHYPQGARAVWIDDEDQVWCFPGAAGAAVGDRLYVREAFCPRLGYPAPIATPHYRADDDRPEWRRLWKPSIHMPRWASRLTLTVTEVRVQRLQEISEADAIAEGCLRSDRWEGFTPCPDAGDGRFFGGTAVASYAALWNSLHGSDAWGANPWVVAVSFTVDRRNIDSITSP